LKIGGLSGSAALFAARLFPAKTGYGKQYGYSRIGCRILGRFRRKIRRLIRLLPHRLPYLGAFSVGNTAKAIAVSVAVF
jgi:hypothetical protein